MHLAPEDVTRERGPEEGCGDVVENAREDEHEREKDEPRRPVVRQHVGRCVHDAALLEMPGEQLETRQQQGQIDERDPLVPDRADEACDAGPVIESRHEELVRDNRREAGQRNRQHAMMQERYADERRAEQEELKRNAEDHDPRSYAVHRMRLPVSLRSPTSRAPLTGAFRDRAGKEELSETRHRRQQKRSTAHTLDHGARDNRGRPRQMGADIAARPRFAWFSD
ncbi:MAG: hypothetical protein FD124_2858 [Alphaproteobacteria bacterium]|nr:MAG: hypothetical protein FD124_2858 [Alphaproteobacteria bacterium]